MDQMQADRVSNCKIFIGPCSESVFLRNLTNCKVTVACKQLRTRDCVNCDIWLYAKTDPIIETSHHMRFAPCVPVASHPCLCRWIPAQLAASAAFDLPSIDQ